MSFLSSIDRQDRVILGSLGLAVLSVAVIAHSALRVWHDSVEIKPVQPKTQYITQDTEDSLKLGTLETLLAHYNYAIRDTAAKIVCDRAVNDGSTLELLLWGITRPDYDERLKSLRALAVITDYQTIPMLHTWKAYAALVRSLELTLDPEQEPLDDPYWDEYPLRDMTEKLCLMFLSQLLDRFDCEKLVKARFVEKWLAKQNWGESEVREANFAQYMRYRSNRITDIVTHLQERDSGREALVQSSLIPRGTSHIGADEEQRLGVAGRLNVLLPLVTGDLQQDDHARSLIRSFQQSAEESRLRHRNREAMVLNDGTHPFNNDDIIQQDPGSPP
ncbi:hypothetical protein B0H63DRAFT_54897 [Podospora didyma]|uniref:Cytoskeleton-associated protein n=1 Tax=Podospora didyma TaxID=330526 RepID=A0AAE0U8Q4_9PEZI|nr:hypothetical protein B0H63DRAFT_54897 [Podospora didyma]